MTSSDDNTSRAVVELVRLHIGSDYVRASDAAVARALGVSRVSVSRYLKGESVMETDVLMRANRHLQLPADELAEYMLRLQAETVAPEHAETVAMLRQWLEETKAWPTVITPGIRSSVRKTARLLSQQKRKAGGAAVLVALGISGFFAPSPAHASVGAGAEECILRKVRGARGQRASNPWIPTRFPRRHRPRRRRAFTAPAALPVMC